MAKGFLSGVLWGSVVSVLGLGVVSLQIAPVEPSWVKTAEPTAPMSDEGAKDTDMQDNAQAVAPDATTDVVPDANETPPDAISAPDAPDQAPDVTVNEDSEVAAPDTPDAQVQTPDVEVDTPVEPDAPPAAAESEAPATPDVTPTPDATAPVQPESSDDTGEADIPQSIPDLANTPQIKSESVAPIGDLADGVTTNRLPTIDSAPSDGDDTTAQEPVVVDTLSLAIERNAAVFENPEGRPLMSIVLADQGAGRTGLGDIRNLPFPISVVVDASAADAAQAVSFYRDAGAEVIIKPTLPVGATPKDAEENFQAQTELTGQAVAVFMGEDSGFQGDSALASQVSEILIASGHGLVSEPQGLNTGHKTALKTGVAAGVVFRELDAEGQDGKVIRRFLDNAAFKAGQENGVILLGQAKPDTLQALIEWSLGNRVKSVAMAPISALLLGG